MSYDVGCWVGRVPTDADQAEEIWDELAAREGPAPAALLAFVADVRAEAPDDLAAFDDGHRHVSWAMSDTLTPEGWVVEVVMSVDGIERAEELIRRAATAHGITVWDPQSEDCWVEGGGPVSRHRADEDEGTPVEEGTLALWVGARPTSAAAAAAELQRRQAQDVQPSAVEKDTLDRLVTVLEHSRLTRELDVDDVSGHAVVVLRDDVDRARLAELLDAYGVVGLDLFAGRLL